MKKRNEIKKGVQMSFIVYDVESTIAVRGKYGMVQQFGSMGAAKSAITRKGLVGYAIADVQEFYSKIEKKETKRNMMSGKEFEQGVNTPLCCDPSSETYWSM
jgi:hypothetical protein